MPPFPRQHFPSGPFLRIIRIQQGGFGPGHGLFLLVAFLVVVAALLLIAAALFSRRGPLARAQRPSPAGSSAPAGGPGPVQILDERFARGEIDADDYKQRRELLASHR
jgi:putative membrane protein